ncbi:MAG: hypothetical protein A3J30_00300 [Candidatus Wildermuthbacteria bacterium RIFCSPLOWO2_02_FULL_47_9c]|uniref:Serine protease n=2 Tax=Patescibacteria group TaxID=1783273 RepID=A0A1G2RWZ1_9BACT|nr:MAG: hypothetical protein UY22_C0046G0006 [Candidatus Amesbacteria bacterium GW2011_GWC1_48_10]OHA77323.1 MAG: hypothetical protein A3J30_00300 [Candidatus Wildermuthbacteria bacterium RIFCSPLOWO2_02_FULL_47_9c]
MFVKSIKIVQRAMFPIFRVVQLLPQQMQVGVAGTGFFINSRGYFVSVAHVFDEANQNTKFLYIGKLPENLQNPWLEITEVCRDDDADIYIGKIELKTPEYLRLSKNTPNIGRSVCVSGYPLAEISTDAQGRLEVGRVRRYFQPTFVLDKGVSNSNNRQGRTRKHDGFLVRDVGLFGMSGGPVFDPSGAVVGIQGSVTQPRTSSNGSRTISVENALAIRSNLILGLLKKNKIKANFLGRF